MKTELNQEIIKTFQDLFEILTAITPQQADQVPFEGSWTAGQCVEHMIKAISGMPQICRGGAESTKRRPDEKIPAIKKMFLDFDLKMKSPDFIAPVEDTHDLKAMKAELETIQSELTDIANTQDLSMICKAFEVPGFGPFTKYELISFALIHTQRHTHQLKNIGDKLNA